jgi:DNA-binding NarL/FixJ family response regulator
MIRILVVDDHPAVRAGLLSVLRSEPGLVPLGAVSTADEALDEGRRVIPDVVLVDYELPDRNGLLLTWELKHLPEAPRAVIYSAYTGPRLRLAAALSGADAVVDKHQPVESIFETLRTVAGGGTRLGPIPPDAMRAAAALLDPQDQSIFGLALAGEPVEGDRLGARHGGTRGGPPHQAHDRADPPASWHGARPQRELPLRLARREVWSALRAIRMRSIGPLSQRRAIHRVEVGR